MGEQTGPKFTIVQLLAVIGIVVMLVAFFFPFRRHHGERAYKIKCSSNLRQIALGMKMYANNERGGFFPRTRYDKATADRPTAYTNPSATQPFHNNGPVPNDVTAAVWLILRTQEITTDVFICPESTTATRVELSKATDVSLFSNFTSQANLSYSFQNPYPTEAALQGGFKWSDEMGSDIAIAGDINPGVAALTTVTINDDGKAQRSVNSPNHGYDGQNILYADAHVEWSASPWAGAQQDNVYTYAKADPVKGPLSTTKPTGLLESAGIVGSSTGEFDSVLLPAWDANVPRP